MLDDLAERYHVLAIDLIGFGLSDRKPEPPYFDFDLWIRQIGTALDYLGDTNFGLVGHSLAGALALKAASLDPRVTAVLTTSTMGAPMPVNSALRRYVWRCPTSREEMRQAAQALIADHSLITDAYLDFRMEVVGSKDYQHYFNAMFDQPIESYIQAAVLDDATLAGISAPVLMLHGINDAPIPAETGSIALQPKLPLADVFLLHNCSHSIAMDRRDTFLNAVFGHFG